MPPVETTDKLSFAEALRIAQEIQANNLIGNTDIFAIDIKTGGPKNDRYVSLCIFPDRSHIICENRVIKLTTMKDVEEAQEYIAKNSFKTEEVRALVGITYTNKGKLPSEEAMHTAVGMIVNDSNPSIIEGVEITSVKVLEENLQF